MLLPPDRFRILLFKEVLLLLLLVVILDQSPPSIGHFRQSVGQAFPNLTLTALCGPHRLVQIELIWLFPDIVSDKFLHGVHLNGLHLICLDVL